MDNLLGVALWRQYSSAIEMLDNALADCPDELWTRRVWPLDPQPNFTQQFAEFWHVGYHTLVWLDLYLAGVPEEEFSSPAPFVSGEIDAVESTPDLSYSKEMLRAYLALLHDRCRATLLELTLEEASRPVEYPWTGGQPISYLELLLYNLRHVQEHAAQLSLFLGQHSIPDEAVQWSGSVGSPPRVEE